MTEIYNHELRGCRCVYLLPCVSTTNDAVMLLHFNVHFFFLSSAGKPGGAVLKQPHFELMSLVLYPATFSLLCSRFLPFSFFSPVLALQKTVLLCTLGWQLRHCTSSASWGRGRSHAEGAWPSSKGGNSIPNTDG